MLKKLSENNLPTNLLKCRFAKPVIEWLGYILLKHEYHHSKAILTISNQNTIKKNQVRFSVQYTTSVHSYHAWYEFVTLRTLLTKSVKTVSTETHAKHFNVINLIKGKISKVLKIVIKTIS